MKLFSLSRVYAACAMALLLSACAGGGRSFDYYLLSLSWSPQHCADTGDGSAQCAGARPYGFVLHGLWPEPAGGRGPEHCFGPAFDASLITDDLRSLMPDDSLIEHEWTVHGSCSGLSQSDYFRAAARAYRLVKIPPAFQPPVTRMETTPAAVRRQFADANPDFPGAAFAVKDDGRFLEEVRVCLTADLRPRGCDHAGDTRNITIIVRPAR
jgi:ribonuclease T2